MFAGLRTRGHLKEREEDKREEERRKGMCWQHYTIAAGRLSVNRGTRPLTRRNTTQHVIISTHKPRLKLEHLSNFCTESGTPHIQVLSLAPRKPCCRALHLISFFLLRLSLAQLSAAHKSSNFPFTTANVLCHTCKPRPHSLRPLRVALPSRLR